MTFFYFLLEYYLIKLVGPKKMAQITLKLPQKMLQTIKKHPDPFIEAYHTVGTLKKQCNVPCMMSLPRGIPQKFPVCSENVLQNLGVEGIDPRTSSLECTWLPTRVQSNALMWTAIAV